MVTYPVSSRFRTEMQKITELVVFVTLFYFSAQSELPSDFQTCRRSDEDFNGCLRAAIEDALTKLQKGIPNLKFPPLDPIQIKQLTIGEGDKGAVRVVQKYSDIRIYNVTRSKINKVEATITPTEFILVIDAVVPEMVWDSGYEFNGHIMVLPISGNGQALGKFRSLGVRAALKGELYEKELETYINITKVEIAFAPVNVKTKLTGLFGGNEQLATEMNKLINENWRELWDDVRANYEAVYEEVIKRDVSQIFKNVPLNQLFPS